MDEKEKQEIMARRAEKQRIAIRIEREHGIMNLSRSLAQMARNMMLRSML